MSLVVVGIGVKTSGRSAWLDDPAARSYRRMLAAGCPAGGITDAGRTYAEQEELYRLYRAGRLKATAAKPGTSKHETGRALDLAGSALVWVRAHGAEYGWLRDRVKNEPWHVEYHAAYDKHAAEPQEDDMPLTPADLDAVQKRAHDATVGVMRSEEFQQRLRAAVAAVVPDIVEAVLAAEVPEHPELTGAARRLGIAIRDTRIIARRIQDAV